MFTTKKKGNKSEPSSSFIPPGENAGSAPKAKKAKIQFPRANRKIKTRKLQTPTQAEARKASRMRGVVFASALVVIGILALIITSTAAKQPSYTVYETKGYIAPGSPIVPAELQAVTMHSPVPNSPTLASITHSVPIVPVYAGELLQSPMLTSAKAVPAGDVLIGTSLAQNHVPNAPLYPGEVVNIYFSSTQPVTGTSTLTPGQLIGQAVVISTVAPSSSNANVEVDLAVPNKIAGPVSMAVASSGVTLGLV
ncbi:MAG: hypothetical protein ACYCU8_01030 [Ferrimicrobium acidiphilum]